MDFCTLEDGTVRLFQNIGMKFPLYTLQSKKSADLKGVDVTIVAMGDLGFCSSVVEVIWDVVLCHWVDGAMF